MQIFIQISYKLFLRGCVNVTVRVSDGCRIINIYLCRKKKKNYIFVRARSVNATRMTNGKNFFGERDGDCFRDRYFDKVGARHPNRSFDDAPSRK